MADDSGARTRQLPAVVNPDKSIGALLVRDRLITPATRADTDEQVRRTGHSFLQVLADMDVVPSERLVDFLAARYQVPKVPLNGVESPGLDVLSKVPRDYFERHDILPLSIVGKKLMVAVGDPSNIVPIDDLKAMTGLNIEFGVADIAEIRRAGAYFYDALERDEFEDGFDKRFGDQDDSSAEVTNPPDEDVVDADPAALVRSSEDERVIQIVNALLFHAIRIGASDIHIEPKRSAFRIRFRVDGALREFGKPPPPKLRSAICSRIKIMAQLKIEEKRLPQDGRMRVRFSTGSQISDYDFRVSVMPVRHGEKIVIRILSSANLQTDMRRLGFDTEELAKFVAAIHRPQGIVLVTGPTGSGKTTTLYSALSELSTISENVATVEDPIEYELDGVNQTQTKSDIGLTFAEALRALLRQDPDIILIGEIRDFETAEVALTAAQTGHLVLSTLHTNDAPSTIARLVKMGVDALVLAQRLVRRLCTQCSSAHTYELQACLAAGMSEEEYAAATTTKKSAGCPHCGYTGYKGRVAVYEILPMSDKLHEAIADNASAMTLKHIGVEQGMLTLRRAALRKFFEGLTTLEEVLRRTSPDK